MKVFLSGNMAEWTSQPERVVRGSSILISFYHIRHEKFASKRFKKLKKLRKRYDKGKDRQ